MTSTGAKILVVDDEPAHAEAIRRALTTDRRDAGVRIVGTLHEYRQAASEFRPDIALLDLNLPDGRAVEVLTAPAENGQFPILILTSYGNENIAVEALKAGAIDYVVKSPETFATIPRTIERALREWDLIQQRRRAEQALLESQRDLKRAQAVARVGSWRLDVRRNELHWSEENHRIFGIPPATALTYETFLAIVHPHDREHVHQCWSAALKGAPYDIEHRILVDGKVKWVRERAVLDFDREGRLRGGFGTTQDITELKDATAELSKSEARFSSLFENMQEGLAYCRMLYRNGRPLDFVYLRVNASFERLTGLKDVVGKRVSKIIPGLRASNPEVFEIYGRVARGGRPERFETFVEPLDHWFAVSAYSPEENFFVAVFDIITERKRNEKAREATVEMLRLCNLATSVRELMRELTRFFQHISGCEAVGVRLREGEDFPYYESRGFSAEFLQAENSLCAHDQNGELLRDQAGHPACDCMCGNILCGRFDPAQPFFSPRGSFWSSHTTALLASTTEADRQVKTRNRCNGEGYESVALIPLRLHDETFGLFQFNDRRPGRFSADKIALLENMVDYVAIALAKLRTDAELMESSQLNQQIIHSAGEGVIVYDLALRYRVWNPYMEQLTGMPASQVLNRQPQEVFPFLRDTGLLERLELARDGKAPAPLEIGVPPGTAGFSGWYLDTSMPLRNSRGEVIGVIGTIQDITERKRYEQELEYQAGHDALTGLANRYLLLDRLGQSLIYADRSQRIVGVLLLDLDRFKMINDSLGHSQGDELLRMVAARLNCCVRAGDTVSRLGGDEFVVTLAEVAEENDIGLLVKRIRETLGSPFPLSGRELQITASIGISLYPKDGGDVETLLRHADIAMYQAKEGGGDTLRFFAPDMNLRIQGALELEADLRLALQRGEFILHYQPQVEIASGSITGCEALVRWRHPRRGMVPPGDFIPLAEETGLIVPLGEWVMREACAQLRAWQREGLPPVTVAVNLSARQFRQTSMVDLVQAILGEAGLTPDRLVLELTESMIMHDPTGAAETMRHLKQLGISLSLDDFGTGYSSLNYLRRFPVDRLKIDRFFLTDVTSDPSAATMITSIVAIAHSLGIKAVAEGVETREQLVLLEACQCDELQGYLFSRPLPPEEFARLLREGRIMARG